MSFKLTHCPECETEFDDADLNAEFDAGNEAVLVTLRCMHCGWEVCKLWPASELFEGHVFAQIATEASGIVGDQDLQRLRQRARERRTNRRRLRKQLVIEMDPVERAQRLLENQECPECEAKLRESYIGGVLAWLIDYGYAPDYLPEGETPDPESLPDNVRLWPKPCDRDIGQIQFQSCPVCHLRLSLFFKVDGDVSSAAM